MEWLTDPGIWVGLATLVVLEIVLGVDNLIFIAIIAGRLPPKQRERARRIGLVLAMGMRLALLAGISWVMSLTRPVFTLAGHGFSWRDLILIAGGTFLLIKATMEIHARLEAQAATTVSGPASSFWPVVAQIVALDVVFSLDSVITAVGMVDELYVMMAAVIIAVGVMLVAANPLSRFITARPSLVILCLGFLLMIGLVLVVDGFGVHVPKGYVYAAIGFSVMIEAFNQIARRNRTRLAQAVPPRQRVAQAVVNLLGGVPLQSGESSQAEIAEGAPAEPVEEVFTPLERRMVRGVLDLSRRSIKGIMTHRSQVEWIDASASRDDVLASVRASRFREMPVGRGSIDNLEGIARKEDVLALDRGERFDLGEVMQAPVATPSSATVLDVLELFKRTPLALAIVVDEHGGFEGVVTRTDLLEAIAGDMPETGDDLPSVSQLGDGKLSIDGGAPVADLEEQLGLRPVTDDSVNTAAGVVLSLLGRVPKPGDVVSLEGWRLEIAEMEGLTIRRIVAERELAPDADLQPDGARR
jgi:predicted tellurium resistance membrane protein TerC/Mg2+/Co2+ transporter CorC